MSRLNRLSIDNRFFLLNEPDLSSFEFLFIKIFFSSFPTFTHDYRRRSCKHSFWTRTSVHSTTHYPVSYKSLVWWENFVRRFQNDRHVNLLLQHDCYYSFLIFFFFSSSSYYLGVIKQVVDIWLATDDRILWKHWFSFGFFFSNISFWHFVPRERMRLECWVWVVSLIYSGQWSKFRAGPMERRPINGFVWSNDTRDYCRHVQVLDVLILIDILTGIGCFHDSSLYSE